MNSSDIKKFVEANPKLVSRKKTSLDGVYVLKYRNQVFWKDLWTPELLECRGAVVDEDYNLIVYPLTKIFNYGEREMRFDRDAICSAVRKINGFMAACSWYNGDYLVSTTGSIDSKFADLARKRILQCLDFIPELNRNIFRQELQAGRTYIFEIVDESDPHIIKEFDGVYLIGIRDNKWGSPLIYGNQIEQAASHSKLTSASTFPNMFAAARFFGFLSVSMLPDGFKEQIRFSDIVKFTKTVDHEGYVVYHGQQALKIKSPYYLTTKFFARVRKDKLLSWLDDPEQKKKSIDEEFYPLINHLAEIKEDFADMDEQTRISAIETFLYGY